MLVRAAFFQKVIPIRRLSSSNAVAVKDNYETRLQN